MDSRLPSSVGMQMLAPPDASATASVHGRGLPHDFVTRFGKRFLAQYHLAFADSPHGTAIVADDRRTGRVVGVLLGTLDTPSHYGFLVRRHGVALATLAAARAVRDPALGRDLAQNRAGRYAGGIARSVFGNRRESQKEALEQVGFLTHLVVEEEYRGRGVGSLLVAAYEAKAWTAGLRRLELATMPDKHGAGPFYERLGWEHEGERTSRSGERFALYTRALPEGEGAGC